MTTRTDIPVTYVTSPRIAEVEAPSVEVTMQDLVDTLRIDEESFHKGLSFVKLLNAAGKEDLGGGVKVGITVSLQDTLVSFEGRTTPVETGTITTGSSPPVTGLIQLIDSAADFVAANVARGSFGINYTDRSVFEVFSVDSPTQLTVKVPVNGVENDFDINDDYDVFNVIQVRATGGNLVAVDSVGDPLTSPILPTFGTQVLITASSSATLQELSAIQFSSFNGGVTVDVTSSNTGTAFPTGTRQQPVNNFSDALTIATNRGLTKIFILGNATLDSSLNYDGYIFVGESTAKTTLTVPSGASVVDTEYEQLTIQGTLDGTANLENCLIIDLDFVNGFIVNCGLSGNITLGGNSVAELIRCYDALPGLSAPIIDMGGTGQALTIVDYFGGIELINKTGSDEVTIDISSGRIILDSTITNGNILCRGVGTLEDNSGGTAVVTKVIVDPNDIRLIKQLQAGNVTITGDGPWTIDVLDEDDVTLLARFTISADRKTRTRTV